MKKLLLFALFLFLFGQIATAQDLVWAKGFAFLSPNFATAIDAQGNLYLAGLDLGNHDLDPGPGVWNIAGPSNKFVGFVAKYNASGEPLWVRSIGAPDANLGYTASVQGNPGGHAIKIGPDGHVHVLFYVNNTDSGHLFVYPGPTDTIYTSKAALLTTFDASGALLFAEPVFGSGDCRVVDFYPHADGRITAAGFFEGTLFPGSATRERVSAGLSDGFLYQYNPLNYDTATTRSWRIGGIQKDYCYGIAGDPSGNLFVGGMFFGTCDVNPSDTATFLFSLQNGQISNGYMMQCDADLNFQWAQRFQSGSSSPNRVLTDSNGNGYVSTNISSSIFVHRFSPTGTLEHTYNLGEYLVSASALEQLQIRTDPAGNLHGFLTEPMMPDNHLDAVYKKIDTESGELLSELRFPATIWSSGASLAVDAVGNVLLAGTFEGTIDLDPSAAEQLYAAVGPYPQRLFWVKLNEKCPSLGLKFLDIQPVGCDHDGTARAEAFGGTAPYAYEWTTQPVQQDAIAQFAGRGYIPLQVTDAVGCSRRRELWIDGVSNNNPGFFDLETRPIITTDFRPGFLTHIVVNAANLGCNPVDGTIKIALDPVLQFQSAQPAPDAIIGDTLVWQQSQWDFDHPFSATIDANTPQSIPIGHLITLRAWTETAGETTLSNNTQVLHKTVVGSFDPNDIAASPEGVCDEQAILPSDQLIYSIRFQNTGTASAIHVRILDTLPAELDLNSLRILAASHALAVERLDSMTLAFVFDNINLPDSSSNEAASHGFIQFELAQKSMVPTGTQINNRAAIYFDFNEPVITNSVFRTIADPLPECPEMVSLGSLGKDMGFTVSPNPVSEDQTLRMVLENDYIGDLKIDFLSLDGRVLKSVFTTKRVRHFTYFLEDLSYFVDVSHLIIRISDDRHVVSKLLIMTPKKNP